MSSEGFRVQGTVEKVEASYKGYGDAKVLKGALITIAYTVNATDYETKFEIPQTSVETYPTVGDGIFISIG